MAGLINLPGYNPGNALNFSGLNAGVDTIRENALMQEQMGMKREQLGMQKEKFGMEKQQFADQRQQQTIQRFAAQAQGVDQMQDPAQRKAAWDQILATHPKANELPPTYWDPVNGPKMLIREAEGFMGQKDRAQVGLIQAQTQKALREAAEAGSGFGKDIKPYQTPDGKVWGVQAAANGGRMMHDLSNPNSQPIYVPAGRPMPPGTVLQGGAPAPAAAPGVQPQAGPGGPLTPFRGTRVVGDEISDAATGRPVRNVGSAIEGKEAAEVRGKDRGQAQVDLPRAQHGASTMIKYLDAILNDQNLPNVTGWQGHLPTFRASSVDTEERIKQVQGGVFLEAFKELKGGGAITQIEGEKAERAKARLVNLKQSDAGYTAALRELRNEVMDLYRIAEMRARGAGPYVPPAGVPTDGVQRPNADRLPPSPAGWSIKRID